jgi:hypothetical protein
MPYLAEMTFLSVWYVSEPIFIASVKVCAPTGSSINSWNASLLPACEPPLMTLNAGHGSTNGGLTPARSARCWYSGTPFSEAAASATAIDTPRIAFAPSLPLFGVPSSLIRKSSISFCCVTLSPDLTSSGAMIELTFSTALDTPVCARADVRRPGADGGWIGKRGRTLSDVVCLVAIAELDGLMDTRRRARGHGGAEAAWRARIALKKARSKSLRDAYLFRCKDRPRRWGYRASRRSEAATFGARYTLQAHIIYLAGVDFGDGHCRCWRRVERRRAANARWACIYARLKFLTPIIVPLTSGGTRPI